MEFLGYSSIKEKKTGAELEEIAKMKIHEMTCSKTRILTAMGYSQNNKSQKNLFIQTISIC